MDGEPTAERVNSDDALSGFLAPLAADRRERVRDFVSELVATCPYCDTAVRRNSLRGIDADERLGCLACVTAVLGSCAICRGEVTRKHRRREQDGQVLHQDCVERQQRPRR